MGNKNKAGREVRKPKKDKKAKPASAPTPVIPPSTHATDQHGSSSSST